MRSRRSTRHRRRRGRARRSTPALLTSAPSGGISAVDRREHLQHLGLVGHVGLQRARLAAGREDAVDDALGGVALAGVVDGDGPAFAARTASAVAAPMPRLPPVTSTRARPSAVLIRHRLLPWGSPISSALGGFLGLLVEQRAAAAPGRRRSGRSRAAGPGAARAGTGGSCRAPRRPGRCAAG